MLERYDTVVIGVGGMGAAALFHLAQRGLKVAGVEARGLPHDLGASHGRSRVIRKAYYEHPSYVPLLERSYTLWRALEAESGARLLTLTGCVNLGAANHPHVLGVQASATQHHLPHEVLDARELQRRFPVFRVAAPTVGVFEADGGILNPERCTTAHAQLAVQHGATLLLDEQVLEVVTEPTHVRVKTTRRELYAEKAVVSVGPWLKTNAALTQLGRHLTVTRQVQCWFSAPAELGQMPVFIHFLDDGRAFYGMPPHEGAGVKVCQHGGGAPTTAESVRREVSAEDSLAVRAYLRAHLPTVDGAAVELKTCLYSLTPDGHFMVGEVPGEPRLVVLGGFSGHGYKLCPVMGEIAAQLVMHDASSHDVALFRPGRFDEAAR